MASLQRILNLLFVFVLSLVLIASYVYQFTASTIPCSLCLLQRLAIFAIIIGLLLNLRFGIKAEHYGLSLLGAILGRSISLRQMALHICPLESPPYPGEPVFGFDLYVWAFIIFACCIVAIAVLLILFGFTNHRPVPASSGFFEKVAITLVAFIALAGAVITFLTNGLII
ncbi:MAG: disulfide bond formation protein B [Chlamydiae bacterium]|nr:disulfide bond formation protein B [Chlamydiota bacterium]